MKFVKRQFAKIIDKFWRPRTEFDWVQLHYDLMVSVDSINQERIELLMQERDKAIRQKKKHRHIQAEIESLRTQQLGG